MTKPKKRGPGRPPVNAYLGARNYILQLRLADEEIDQLRQLADSKGLTVSEFVRWILFGTPPGS